MLESIGVFLNSVLNPVFSPLLVLPPFFSILVMSFVISLVVSVIYKYTTDQDLMRRLKAELKELQAEMKLLRSEPEKMMVVQKKAMETNMKYMSHSFKSTLFTFIPILIIFSWMGAHLAYYPLSPNEEFAVSVLLEDGLGLNASITAPEGIEVVSDAVQKINSNSVGWKLKGVEGSYVLSFLIGDKEYEKDILITKEKKYVQVEKAVNDGVVKSINSGNAPIKPINLFGWKIGWLGTYIIFSIFSSILLRKIMKLA
jgi:uncharacterized membrane protein (DUF106 family)